MPKGSFQEEGRLSTGVCALPCSLVGGEGGEVVIGRRFFFLADGEKGGEGGA